MNKTELVADMSAKSGLSKKSCEAALNAFVEAVSSALSTGDEVKLIGFGSFGVSERAARTGKNPQTGEKIKIAACKAPKFKVGASLKQSVNSSKKKK